MIKKRVLIPIIIISIILLICSGYISNGFYQSYKLYTAVENNDYESAKKAIERGAWINKHRYILYISGLIPNNPTPLIMACWEGNQEMVELLIENGADVNLKDNCLEQTPLIAAISRHNQNRFRITMYIIEKGGDIHCGNGNSSVFYYALYIDKNDSEQNVAESVALIKYLLENNVDPKMCMGNKNALTRAACCNNYGAVDFLIEEGYYCVDYRDEEDNTALTVAAQYDNVKTVEVLLKHGADTSICDATGKTAFDYAVGNGNKEIIRLLEEHSEQLKTTE